MTIGRIAVFGQGFWNKFHKKIGQKGVGEIPVSVEGLWKKFDKITPPTTTGVWSKFDEPLIRKPYKQKSMGDILAGN